MLTRSRVTGASEYPTVSRFYGFDDRGISILLHDGAQGVPVHQRDSYLVITAFWSHRHQRPVHIPVYCGPSAPGPGNYWERKVLLDNGSCEYQIREQLPDNRETRYHRIETPEQVSVLGEEYVWARLRWDYAAWREAND